MASSALPPRLGPFPVFKGVLIAHAWVNVRAGEKLDRESAALDVLCRRAL